MKFDLYENMENIADSMQFENGAEIARYEDGDYTAYVSVTGDVRVLFSPSGNDEDTKEYCYVSEFPQELKDIIAEGNLYNDNRIQVENNNWFELTVFFGSDEMATEIVEAEKMNADAIRELCAEIVNAVRDEVQADLQHEDR